MIIFNEIAQPRRYTPTGAEHVYSFTSDNITETNFKFVIDVWSDPLETYKKRIARLKIRPNQYGYAHIDVNEIIQSLVKPNIRARRFNRQQMSIDKFYRRNAQATLPRLVNYAQSNAYSEIDSSPDFEYYDMEREYHVREYRVLVGEEYQVSGLTETFIADDPSVLRSNFSSKPHPIGSYPVSNPAIAWADAQGDVVIEWYDPTETTLKGGTSITGTPSGNWETPTQPAPDDKLLVTDTYSDITYKFRWDNEGTAGWIFMEIIYNDPFNGTLDPYNVIIVPGADNRIFNTRDIYNDLSDTPLLENHLYDNNIFHIPVTRTNYTDFPSRIPIIAPLTNKLNPTDEELGQRRFTIYQSQPLVFPMLCGDWFADFGFRNEIRSATMVSKHTDGTTKTFNKDNTGGFG